MIPTIPSKRLRTDPGKLELSDLLKPSVRDGRIEGGVHSYIAQSPELEQILEDRYGRSGLCLKIFKRPLAGLEPDLLQWGKNGARLGDATKAQNIFSWYGVSPRVYDLIEVDGKAAQVTDYASDWILLEGGRGEDRDLIKEIRQRHHIRAITHDMNEYNWVNGFLVDTQFYHLALVEYEPYLRRLAYQNAAWGSRSEPYQAVPLLGIPGQRDLGSRAALMGLDDLDWQGKDVLDLGCNLGAILWYLDSHGLRQGVGIDRPHVADTAREISNYLGFWGLDFYGMMLPQNADAIPEAAGIPSYDAVFALSVDAQIGYAPWMADLTHDLFFLEGHVPDRRETFEDRLRQDFREVEYLGMSRDHGPRPVFRCRK